MNKYETIKIELIQDKSHGIRFYKITFKNTSNSTTIEFGAKDILHKIDEILTSTEIIEMYGI